jgi:hypothetical protein
MTGYFLEAGVRVPDEAKRPITSRPDRVELVEISARWGIE